MLPIRPPPYVKIPVLIFGGFSHLNNHEVHEFLAFLRPTLRPLISPLNLECSSAFKRIPGVHGGRSDEADVDVDVDHHEVGELKEVVSQDDIDHEEGVVKIKVVEVDGSNLMHSEKTIAMTGELA